MSLKVIILILYPEQLLNYIHFTYIITKLPSGFQITIKLSLKNYKKVK